MGQKTTKTALPALLKAAVFLPKLTTGCGTFALQNSPDIGEEETARSQVGALVGSPLIHRPYYHYYYSYLIKYMWRKE
jgi:outer membrane protein assembly factor BamE (lipoprotein component of BamABCDE complex)